MRNPFTTSPVWGERFFGREKILAEILYGLRDCYWVAGLRRIGKTSLLKQLDYLARKENLGYIGVYFDLEGCHNRAALQERLLAKLDMSADMLAAHGVDTAGWEGRDFFALLQELLRRVHRAKKKLLLLCDEAEALIEIARHGESETLARLRGILQDGDYIRTVLTSTQNLKELKNFPCLTSPFLNGFEPPIYLAHFNQEESARLIKQINEVDKITMGRMFEAAGHHPFLTQWLAMKFWDGRDLSRAIDEIEHSAMLAESFIKEDFQPLTSHEKKIVMEIVKHAPVGEARVSQALAIPLPVLKGHLANLANLGLIKETTDGFICANLFFKSWLEAFGGDAVSGAEARLTFDDVVVDFKRREVYKNGREVKLTRKEFDILKALLDRRGEAVDRFDLLGWSPGKEDENDEHEFTTRTIDMLVTRLRKKLGDDPARPKYIESIRGIGYKLIAKAYLA